MAVEQDRLNHSYATARDALLSELTPAGHWVGELSTSALSTATAVMALELMRRAGSPSSTSPVAPLSGNPQGSAAHCSTALESEISDSKSQITDLRSLIDRGLAWLAGHQNGDGGWGDTVQSFSNISTTFLARAVFRATNTEDRYRSVVDRAVAYIDRAGGIPAVIARYGKDRTFSVPILTHCALAGLVNWRDVPALPFELACLPARFYKTVRLPVVSYALPALIAIGQVRHHHAPTRNPFLRPLRRFAANPALKVLERIQPSNGGFLEAAPLTSFVTMSLAGMGLAGHPVAQKGTQFLIVSVRPDGSWPIDTNLATWVTTLAVNALGDDLPEEHREPILRWLLDQQYQTVHPYTNADPGGWAWTDLPGSVPDADDTPGAILALLQLVATHDDIDPFSRDPQGSAARDQRSPEATSAIRNGIRWLLDLQNRDGGFPTFCRGWGKLPFDRSSPDITAHAIRAMIRLGATAKGELSDDIRYIAEHGHSGVAYRLDPNREYFYLFERHRSIGTGFRFLRRAQRSDGSWLPLWFGNQHAPDDINPTYGTSRVLEAYRAAGCSDFPEAQRGYAWLRENQNPDGGWGAGPGTPSSTEETALAAEILLSDPAGGESARRGIAWLCDRIEAGTWRDPAPIGFYFAKLWYFERLYPLIFTVAALRAAGGTSTMGRTKEH
jgi:squalene-hopene/tetraprenyl-beta-curcumene cyclase